MVADHLGRVARGRRAMAMMEVKALGLPRAPKLDRPRELAVVITGYDDRLADRG
jgi:hypothetical protein